MQLQRGEMPGDGVSVVAFYREFLKLITEVECLKAELAYRKADEQETRLRAGRVSKKVTRQRKG